MDAIMDGRAQPSQIAGLLVGLAMKGERPAEIVGLAQTMRGRATQLSRTFAPVFDTCGTGGDRRAYLQCLDRRGAGAGGVRRARREARQPIGLEPVRQRRPVRGARRERSARTPAIVERCLDEAGIAFLFAPTFHPSMRHAGPTRKELGVRTAFNLLGPLTNPAGASRQLVGVPRPGAHRAGRAIAGAARRGARVGRARRRWPRRDLDDRLHEGLGVPRRRGQHVLPASGRRRPAEGGAGSSCAAATPPTTPPSPAPSWPASPARRATSCS